MRRYILLIGLLAGLVPSILLGADDGIPPPADNPAMDDDFDEFGDFDEDFPPDGDFTIVSDPLEPFNRTMFWFNDKLYFYVLKPVARVYRHVPEPVRVSVANFSSNLGAPVRAINAGLQLKPVDAGSELARFLINSTVGIVGLFDPARKYAGIREKDEDFGQTLGAYGAGPGFYLVLPFFGPSTLRDATGLVVDTGMSPVYHYARREDRLGELAVFTGFEAVNTLSLDKDTYEGIKRDALDPYQFLRDAYIQNREGKIGK